MDRKQISNRLMPLKKFVRSILQSRKKTAIAILVIALFGFFGWKTFAQSSKQPQYQTAQVEKGSIVATVSESGSVVAGNQVDVPSTTTGVIEEVYVKDGDTVSAGDNLFKVKSTATPQQKASAYTSYLSAQNTLNSAQAKMNSLQSSLFVANRAFVTDRGIQNPITDDPQYIIERANWLQAESDYNNQKGVIAQAQASLNSASLALQATQNAIVTAPVGGTIANFTTNVGGYVSAGGGSNASSQDTASTTTSGGTPILVIGDFSQVSVTARASEVDIPKLKLGQKATITLDAFPGKTFVGTVSQINKIGTTTSGVVTYNITVSFVSAPSDVLPGMTASMTIQIARADDAIIVPSSAIQNTNGQSTIRVLKNGQVTQASVETGLTSDTDTEIISGLSVGDTIVTSIVTTTGTGTRSQGASPFSGIGGRGFGGGGGFRGGGGEGH